MNEYGGTTMKLGILKNLKPFIAKHEPEILMAMGLSGLIFSTVWGVKATVKAVKKVDIRKQELNVDKLSTKEIIKQVWPLYVPVILSAGLSVPMIILGNRVSTKRHAALAAAYTISETALYEYQEKTKEVVGERKEKQIKEAVSDSLVKKTYPNSSVILTGDGDNLFYEPLSGRYFKSNWNKILKAANYLNADALVNMGGTVSLSDWFDELGLDHTEMSDNMGWELMDGTRGLIDIAINAVLTPDDIPCGSISYNNRPKIF